MTTNPRILELWEVEAYTAEAVADHARAGSIDEVIRLTIEHTMAVIELKAYGEAALTLTQQKGN
jgi:hypothetical protein